MVRTSEKRHGKVSFNSLQDIAYTEIRPVRPNQSVILAGLGVQGRKLPAWQKDRAYRSTQGAGYSDGLVLHAARPRTQEGWPSAKEVVFHLSSSAGRQPRIEWNVDQNNSMSDNTSRSILSSSHERLNGNGVDSAYNGESGSSRLSKHLEVKWANTNDSSKWDENENQNFYDQTSGQTNSRSNNRHGSSRSRASSRTSSRSGRRSTSRTSSRTSSRSGQRSSSRTAQRESGIQTPGGMSEYQQASDEELNILGETIVRSSLRRACRPQTDDSDSDLTDLAAELVASDLRADQFTEIDYYRSGLSPNKEAYIEKN